MFSTYKEPFELRIQPGKSKNFKLRDGLSTTTKIGELRQIIADRLGVSDSKTLWMIYKAKKLIEEDDDKTFEEKGIERDSTIVIAIRQVGGMDWSLYIRDIDNNVITV